MDKKTQIEIELSETIAYSRRGERFEAYCQGCEALVEMATPHIAAILNHATEREIFAMIEAGKIHFIETETAVLICLKSLNDL